MDFPTGLPLPVALAVIAVLGYLVGRRSRAQAVSEADKARRELRRAKLVAKELEQVAESVRKNLANHQLSVARFKDRIGELSGREKEAAWQHFTRVSREFLNSGDWEASAPAIATRTRSEDEFQTCNGPDGARIAYATNGSGFPIVKAPNWMTHLKHDWTSPVYGHWYEFAVQLGKLIRMDLRGFGLSDWDTPSFTFDDMVGDMEVVLDHAQLERFDLVAVSHGCAFAMAYAARHPERVRKLVLVNSFAAGWRVRADPQEIAFRESLLEMNRQRPSFRRSLLGEMFITLYFPSASDELIAWHNEHFQTLGPVPNMEKMIQLASMIDVRDELPKIKAETLIFHADKDGNAPVHVGRQVAEAIAGARFIELDSANHVLLGDEPAWRQFTRQARAFLRG